MSSSTKGSHSHQTTECLPYTVGGPRRHVQQRQPRLLQATVGAQFGAWTVTAPASRASRYKASCRCICGLEKQVVVYDLLSGKSRSCHACSITRTIASKGQMATFHDITLRRLKRRCKEAYARCTNPTHRDYKFYGQRGITFCFDSPTAMAQYVLTLASVEEIAQLTIDRIDNMQGYCPGNIQLVTQAQQCQNRRPYPKKRKSTTS